MANTLKFGNGNWAVKEGSTLAYNDENNNFKPLPFNFERDSSATVINKDGLIETVGSGQPRIDYKDDSKGALLLEPSRSNLLQYSEDFSQSSWDVPFGNIISNAIISPNGSIDADELNFIGQTEARIAQSPSISNGTSYTFSMYIKADENGTVQSNMYADGNNYTTINVTTEWKRVNITFVAGSTNIIFAIDNRNFLETLNKVYIYGAQLEQGSYATSYIPTQGSTVTRLADSSTNCGAGTNIFSNTSAVWFIDFSRFVYDSSIRTKAMTLENSSGVEQIRFHFDQPANTVRFRDALNSYSTIGGYISTLDNTRKKVALKIDGTTLSAFSDGVKIGSDYTRPTGFDIDTMDLYWGGSNIFDIKFYNTALTDAELIALTS